MIKNTINQFTPRVIIMFINQLSTLMTIPWLTSHISLQTFGLVATGLIIIQSSWIFIEWGGSNYATESWNKEKSENKKNIFITNFIISRLFLSAFYLIIIYFLILFKLIILPINYFYAVIPAVIFGANLPLWFFNLIKKPGELVVITLLSRLIFLYLVISFVKVDNDAVFFFIFLSTALAVITIYAIFIMRIKHKVSWKEYKFKKALEHIKKSSSYFINSLTNNHVQSIWSLALTLTGSPIAIGIYNIAEQGYRAGNAISNAISQIVRINSISQPLIEMKSLILFYSILYFFITLLSLFIVDDVITYVFTSEFYDSIPILKIIILIWFFQALISLINYPVLGKLITPYKIHKLNSYFIALHLLSLIIWFIYFNSILDMVNLFLVASIVQLLILILSIKKSYKTDTFNSNMF
jgi:O-antigen/teichoic acid export membrane protein